MPLKMTSICKRAAAVLQVLTADLDVGESRKFDRAAGYMAVHVECLQRSALGTHYSVAHYFEQNGDLMPDPDVVLVRRADGSFCPISFQNSLVFNQPVRWLEDGTIEVDARQQASIASFANTLLRNIGEQQNLGGAR